MTTIYSILKTTLLGDLLMVANGTQLTGIYYLNCKHAPAVQNDWSLNPRHPVLRQAGGQLQEYLDGKRTNFSLPLDCAGTDFQKEVWRQIALIPFGQTVTYSELAKRAGAAHAIRAAGTATGRNPLSIVIPCHRVVGKDGSLGGYAGGLPRKQLLLETERRGNHLAV